MVQMPLLKTGRLRVRPFQLADLEAAHQLLDIELADTNLGTEPTETLAERARWLRWAALNGEQLARLRQPPYGDRAIVLTDRGELIGSCGFVPCLMPFEQLSYFGGSPAVRPTLTTPEFGLFYAISPRHRRRGYATEAAQALIRYAFHSLQLKRVVATTDYNNEGSIGVMRRLGMRILSNPYPDPPWLQIVGVLEHPAHETERNQ